MSSKKAIRVDKSFWYRLGAITLLLIIAIIMLFIGRKHIVYVDNKTFENDGASYSAMYKVEVSARNNDNKKLYARERGELVMKGQSTTLHLTITQAKGGSEESIDYKLYVPFGKDAVVINIPALLAGLPQDVWMTDFVSLATPSSSSEADTVDLSDDFGFGDDL